MPDRLRIPLAAALLLATAGAHADNLKPGLWEISQTMQSGSGQMEKAMAEMNKQMAAMTPEQRKMMQEALGKQGGSMPQGGGAGQPMTAKMCITKEMAERNEVAPVDGNCKSTMAPRSGNSMKFSFSCANPPSSGEGEVSFSGSTAYTSKVNVKTVVNGKPETMQMQSSGRWLAAECGAVKPPVLPKK